VVVWLDPVEKVLLVVNHLTVVFWAQGSVCSLYDTAAAPTSRVCCVCVVVFRWIRTSQWVLQCSSSPRASAFNARCPPTSPAPTFGFILIVLASQIMASQTPSSPPKRQDTGGGSPALGTVRVLACSMLCHSENHKPHEVRWPKASHASSLKIEQLK
jgi:hypothetical protein